MDTSSSTASSINCSLGDNVGSESSCEISTQKAQINQIMRYRNEGTTTFAQIAKIVNSHNTQATQFFILNSLFFIQVCYTFLQVLDPITKMYMVLSWLRERIFICNLIDLLFKFEMQFRRKSTNYCSLKRACLSHIILNRW